VSGPPPHVAVKSFAKINLVLAVLGKRTDGYHEIRTVFQTISLHDCIDFRPAAGLELHCEGLPVVASHDNLVWKAARALRSAAGTDAGAHITLTKAVPSGAGLGGGSSNAAATLLGLRRLWGLEVPETVLDEVAAGLGSDVSFFLRGGTALGLGRGEQIVQLPDAPASDLVVVYPGEGVSTAEAYRGLGLGLTWRDEDPRIQRFCGRLQSGELCTAGFFNDFETSILPAYPAVKEARDFLLERGATTAMLSGSGSSVFGFFSDEESALAVSRHPMVRGDWRVFPAKTLSRAEYFKSMFG